MALIVISSNNYQLLSPSIRHQVGKLATILRDYRGNWSDPLSEKLKKWSQELFAIILDVNLFVEEKIKLGQAKIDELSRGILIDPLTRQLLQNPVLERTWTWEKEMHTWYFTNSLPFPSSPFDKQPMVQKPKSHDFAQKMVDWLNYFKIKKEVSDEKQPEMGNAMVPYAQRPMDAMARCAIMILAGVAVSQRKNEEMRMSMVKASLEEDGDIKTARELHAEKLKAFRAKAEAHEEEIRANFEAVKEVMNNKIQILEERMTEQEKLHISEMEDILSQMDNQDQSNSQIAEAMMRQLQQIQEDHQQKNAILKKQINELQEQIPEVVQRFNGAFQLNGERAQIHEQIIKDQRLEMEKAHERILQLHENLSAKERTIAQLAGQVAALSQSLQYAHQRINDMQTNDDGCAIM